MGFSERWPSDRRLGLSSCAGNAALNAPIYHLRGVVKARNTEAVGFRLVIPELDIHAGEKVALVGQSGCGKSTLLDMLAMVLRPSEAAVLRFTPRQAADIDIADLWVQRDLNRLSELRRQHIGYVLQTGGLLPFLSVRDNILLSRRLLSLPTDNFVVFLANALGIHRQLDKLPGLLSAGERQRVAIARALAHRPSIVIADEPTASLDPVTAQRTMALFMELADEVDVTVILASHDWAEIDKLGLRKLRQKSIQKAGGKVTESVFSG